MTGDRYTRQIRLAEVGELGQQRIESASASVLGLDGADIEIRYLRGAGLLNVVHEPSAAPLPFAHESYFRFAASRRVAAGAWRALGALRRTLGVSS